MTGSITKHPQKNGRISGGYYFRAGKDANGKWIQPMKQGFATKREAEDKLREAIAEADAKASPAQSEPPACTFAELFNEWMAQYAERHCQPKTIERYRELGAYVVRLLGDMPIRDIKPFTLEKTFNAHAGPRRAGYSEVSQWPPGLSEDHSAYRVSDCGRRQESGGVGEA